MVCEKNCSLESLLGMDAFGRPRKDSPTAVSGSIVFSPDGANKPANVGDKPVSEGLQARNPFPNGTWLSS